MATREVLGGSPGGRGGCPLREVAAHTWRKRFEAQGMVGLADRSRRPKSGPRAKQQNAADHSQPTAGKWRRIRCCGRYLRLLKERIVLALHARSDSVASS